MSYNAPLKEIAFALKHLVPRLPAGESEVMDLDTALAVVEECAKLCESVIAPLNFLGDQSPSTWSDGTVTTTAGFKEAFREYTQGGWQGLQHPEEYGGQALPKWVAAPCTEILNSANVSFALCPLLTDGAIEALLTAGSSDLKEQFIPNMISGKWTGSMNLTEPQAGSDLELVRTRAEPQADGSYKVFGTKIFITYGEHDMAENIVHLVLARIPGAPTGVKGISLFVVPKFLVSGNGVLGARNDVYCVSIEHKLGIKASPTAVLQYGDHGGATGYIVGQENRGLEYMFIMMNAARFGVGLQGIAVAERAYQQALAYAKDRVQSRPVDGTSAHAVAIIRHPDVKRMLLTMRSLTHACRGLAYYASGLAEIIHSVSAGPIHDESRTLYEFLIPLLKGFATEMSVEVASLGIQVHGGMGFIEETGAAQHLRDAKILAIYEGTTAIQANDLVGRKTLRDGGKAARLLADYVLGTQTELARLAHADANAYALRLGEAIDCFRTVVNFICENGRSDLPTAFAASVPYLFLGGILAAGWQMGRSMLAVLSSDTAGSDPEFEAGKLLTVRFFGEHILTRTLALRESVLGGSALTALAPVDAL